MLKNVEKGDTIISEIFHVLVARTSARKQKILIKIFLKQRRKTALSVVEIVGLQYGNEGKEKFIAEELKGVKYCIQASDGMPEQRQVEYNDELFTLQFLPSSIFSYDVVSIIPAGVHIELVSLMQEIMQLRKCGIKINAGNMQISPRARVTFPMCSIAEQVFQEVYNNKILENYNNESDFCEHQTAQSTLTFGALMDFSEEWIAYMKNSSKYISERTKYSTVRLNRLWNVVRKFKNFFREFYRANIDEVIYQSLVKDNRILVEGTSSLSYNKNFGAHSSAYAKGQTASELLALSGIGPRAVSDVIGVAKMYTLFQGVANFTTEIRDKKLVQSICMLGNEYDPSTGEKYRIGWLDLMWLKHAIRINGVNKLCLNGMDVVGKLEQIQVCMAYSYKGTIISYVPYDPQNCSPIYKTYATNWPHINSSKVERDDTSEIIAERNRLKQLLEMIERFVNNGEPDKAKRKVKIYCIGWENEIEWGMNFK